MPVSLYSSSLHQPRHTHLLSAPAPIQRISKRPSKKCSSTSSSCTAAATARAIQRPSLCSCFSWCARSATGPTRPSASYRPPVARTRHLWPDCRECSLDGSRQHRRTRSEPRNGLEWPGCCSCGRGWHLSIRSSVRHLALRRPAAAEHRFPAGPVPAAAGSAVRAFRDRLQKLPLCYKGRPFSLPVLPVGWLRLHYLHESPG